MMLLIYKWFFQENSKFRGFRSSRGSIGSGQWKFPFQKIENLEVLEVPKVPDVISIYISVYKSIFQRNSKFKGFRDSIGSG